jgi:hypothetical protein
MKPQIRISDMETALLPLGKWVKLAPLPLHWVLLVIPAMLACFELLPAAQADLPPPPPEGGYPDGNTAVGTQALLDLTTGQDNTALGFRALTENTQGNLNTAVGSTALKSNRVGSRNTATGHAALFDNSAGNNNTANGYHALQTNKGNNQTAVGSGALEDATTGSNNTALGYESSKNLSIGSTDNIDVGNRGVAGESATIRVGSADQTKSFIAGIHGAVLTGGGPVVVNSSGQLGRAASSERFKEEIKPMGKESQAILALKPVTFRYKKEIDPQRMLQFGLIAEEVEKVNPDLVVRDSEGKPYTVRYDAVNAMLLNEFLKAHRKVVAVESGVARLAASVREQDAKIRMLSAQLELSKPDNPVHPAQVPEDFRGDVRSRTLDEFSPGGGP